MYINETNSQIGDLIQLSINDKLNDYTITGVIQFRGVSTSDGYKDFVVINSSKHL